jgi:hypothetical protein
VLDHNRQGLNRMDIMVVQRRCCPKSCDKRVRYGFVGQGGAPTLQENNKKTVADFLGSQQKLGRRFTEDAVQWHLRDQILLGAKASGAQSLGKSLG